MTPGEASRNQTPLVIEHPLGGVRHAAYVFDLEGGGIAWVDDTWLDGGGHAEHLVRGQVDELGQEIEGASWAMQTPDGDVFISVMGEAGPPDQRARAREAISQSLDIPVDQLSP